LHFSRGFILVPRCRSFVTLCGTTALLTACAGGPAAFDQSAAKGKQPIEYLDEKSGATVTAMDRPLLFARDRSERAANLRDYVTITAATVNRGGKRDYLLIAYIWSTLDARYEPARPVADTLVLVADDRRIRLDARGGTPADFGIIRAVGAPAGRTVKPLVFPTDLATLRYVAAARSLQVQANVGDDVLSYILWDDQRKALDRLVRFLDGER
jgi:hypothetical protein